jgi:hypothetical protein
MSKTVDANLKVKFCRISKVCFRCQPFCCSYGNDLKALRQFLDRRLNVHDVGARPAAGTGVIAAIVASRAGVAGRVRISLPIRPSSRTGVIPTPPPTRRTGVARPTKGLQCARAQRDRFCPSSRQVETPIVGGRSPEDSGRSQRCALRPQSRTEAGVSRPLATALSDFDNF